MKSCCLLFLLALALPVAADAGRGSLRPSLAQSTASHAPRSTPAATGENVGPELAQASLQASQKSQAPNRADQAGIDQGRALQGRLFPTVSADDMQRVYEEFKTPFKYGVILRGEPGELVDCPNVFRHGDRWYMLYVASKNKAGYESYLAESEDLLHWTKKGKVLPFPESGWDKWQADGSIALFDTRWGGSNSLGTHQGKYWMSYFGGDKQGYEPDPLSIGLAWTLDPTKGDPWTRHSGNPVLTPNQPDARDFEKATLYKSSIFKDEARTLGADYVMFYNAKQAGKWVERIGIAVSDDMVTWRRHGTEPVIDNKTHISGDPQIIRWGDLWVMHYFGAGWKPAAFDTFAVSRDLVNWTKWTGVPLLSPTESWDKTFAHKPWLIKHEGIVYHFYCAVAGSERVLAVATSKDLRRE